MGGWSDDMSFYSFLFFLFFFLFNRVESQRESLTPGSCVGRSSIVCDSQHGPFSHIRLSYITMGRTRRPEIETRKKEKTDMDNWLKYHIMCVWCVVLCCVVCVGGGGSVEGAGVGVCV